MILGYARVSTGKREQTTSLKSQVKDLKAAGCQKIVQERKSAYKDAKRPGWESCKAMIAEGLVTKFMLVSLQRGSRRQENSQMSELCNLHGVEFVVLTGGNVNVDTPEGLLNVGIQDTFNKFDSKLKSIRVTQGIAARRRDGATACGKCPFGWKYDGNKPVPDPKQWGQAKKLWAELEALEFRATQLLKHGTKWNFSPNGLVRWMRNPILYGVLRYSDVTVEPLVTQEQWLRCQKILDGRSFAKARGPKKIHLLTQMVHCDGCGRFMQITQDGGKPRLKCMLPQCNYYGRGLAVWKVRNQLIELLRNSVDDMAAAMEATAPRNRTLSPEQIAAQRDLDQCLELQARGIAIDQKSISELRAKLAVTVALPGPNWGYWRNFIRQHGILERMTDDEFRSVISELVEEIRYVGSPLKVKITLRDAA